MCKRRVRAREGRGAGTGLRLYQFRTPSPVVGRPTFGTLKDVFDCRSTESCRRGTRRGRGQRARPGTAALAERRFWPAAHGLPPGAAGKNNRQRKKPRASPGTRLTGGGRHGELTYGSSLGRPSPWGALDPPASPVRPVGGNDGLGRDPTATPNGPPGHAGAARWGERCSGAPARSKSAGRGTTRRALTRRVVPGGMR
jgi:hypothetical protein